MRDILSYRNVTTPHHTTPHQTTPHALYHHNAPSPRTVQKALSELALDERSAGAGAGAGASAGAGGRLNLNLHLNATSMQLHRGGKVQLRGQDEAGIYYNCIYTNIHTSM